MINDIQYNNSTIQFSYQHKKNLSKTWHRQHKNEHIQSASSHKYADTNLLFTISHNSFQQYHYLLISTQCNGRLITERDAHIPPSLSCPTHSIIVPGITSMCTIDIATCTLTKPRRDWKEVLIESRGFYFSRWWWWW